MTASRPQRATYGAATITLTIVIEKAYFLFLASPMVNNAKALLLIAVEASDARVAELVDALDLGSSDFGRGGSSPPFRRE